jgi:penicillin-binding protein 1A
MNMQKVICVHRGATAVPFARGRRSGESPWTRGVIVVLTCAAVVGAVSVGAALFGVNALHHVYFQRQYVPDLGPFTRFEFPTIGRISDINDRPLIELAREYRQITQYADIPPIVHNAILATEDKHFFSHNGLDYFSIPRVLGKVRVGAWATRLATAGRRDNMPGRAIFPQGGSTITQQLVRGVFLQSQTSRENSYELRNDCFLARALSSLIGARNVNMVLRKREEMRLTLWIEEQMRERFGSKRRAKEEILARYASFVYMGNGQYGFAQAAEYYFGRRLSTFTADDADKAAVLASIAKSPRDYAPDAHDGARVLRRRNQTLALMAAENFISRDQMAAARQRPLSIAAAHTPEVFQSSAVVAHVLEELKAEHPDLGIEDLLQGRIQVNTTVDARVQRIVNEALQHGLQKYEQRHPRATGLTQGAVVVLKNSDGSILAEVGGREVYQGRATSYSDFNRVRQSMRQPGSTMKPMVYLAAFRSGDFTLESLVPDEPISVPNGRADVQKWISNYDGRFKGLIPIREALAESRNAVAVWITEQIGIDAVLQTSRSLGVQTSLERYTTTALGASEVNLLELATAYRTIASGLVAEPYVIRRIVRDSGEAIDNSRRHGRPASIRDDALSLIQEGLRGVVRIPTGTAHALNSRGFPIAVMGKTGTTNEFRDALFVGSTYGVDGITVAVRIGFDDNRSLGSKETGGRLALPVFQELMLKIYRSGIVGPVPAFPDQMEKRITAYLNPAPTMLNPAPTMLSPAPTMLSPAPAEVVAAPVAEAALAGTATGVHGQRASAAELGWLRQNGATVSGPVTTIDSFTTSRDR